MKKCLSLLLVFVMLMSIAPTGELSKLDLFTIKASAATYTGTCGTNLTWSLDTSTEELIISGTGAMSDWSVSSFAPWYNYRSSIKSVTIEDGITNIGSYAFKDCSHLASATIGNGITSISSSMFNDCIYLTSITMGNGITSIGDRAFYYCNKLKTVNYAGTQTQWNTIVVGDGNSILTSAEIIYECNSERPYYSSGTCGTALSYVLYTDGELVISGTGDMTNWSSFSSVPWDNKSSSVNSVTIGNGVTSIGDRAFYYCDRLTIVTIPDSVTSVGKDVFGYGDRLKTVNYAGTPTQWSNVSIENGNSMLTSAARIYECNSERPYFPPGTCGADLSYMLYTDGELVISGTGDMRNWSTHSNVPWFSYHLSIKSITIKSSVTSIGSYAFSYCYNLTSVTIPDSVTSIGVNAFNYCSSLKSIEIPDSVTIIDDYTFDSCTNLASIKIPDSITSIGCYSFENCSGLTSIEIPDSVTSINSGAFYNCTELKDIILPDSAISIGGEAFLGTACYYNNWENGVLYIGKHLIKAVASIGDTYTVKDGTLAIAASAFELCEELTSITIPDSVKIIAAQAFYDCSSLTSIEIPDSVTGIGWWAFADCVSLTNVTIGSGVTSIGSYAFSSCINLVGVTIKNGVTSIGHDAFINCENLTNIEIPDSVESIGDNAFWCCSDLTSVTIGSGVTGIGNYAFYSCNNLTDVYYNGTEEEWNAISIGSGNDSLNAAAKHFTEAPHEHSYEATVTAPTCTEGGYTTYACSCGDRYIADETTALDHSFGSWILTTPPTTEKDGAQTRTCTRCGETETRAVPKLPKPEKASFIVSSGKVHPGETVEITVNVENNPGIIATKISLCFDDEFLTLTDVRNGEVFADSVMDTSKDITYRPYSVLWTDALAEENNKNNGTLVTFVFTASATAPECTVNIDIEYAADSTFDYDLNDVGFTVEGGKVEITHRIPGDPDGDGVVTLKDAVIIERYLADWGVTISDMSNADVDGDGTLTLKDAVLIERYLADWDVELV